MASEMFFPEAWRRDSWHYQVASLQLQDGTKSCRIKMRHSLASLKKSRTSPPALLDHPMQSYRCVHTAVFFIYQEQKRPRTRTIVRLSNKHVRTHVLVRQDLLQHLQGVLQTFFSVLVRLSRLNYCKPILDCLEYPDPRVSICCFSV